MRHDISDTGRVQLIACFTYMCYYHVVLEVVRKHLLSQLSKCRYPTGGVAYHEMSALHGSLMQVQCSVPLFNTQGWLVGVGRNPGV
jgi:hypothetical protein